MIDALEEADSFIPATAARLLREGPAAARELAKAQGALSDMLSVDAMFQRSATGGGVDEGLVHQVRDAVNGWSAECRQNFADLLALRAAVFDCCPDAESSLRALAGLTAKTDPLKFDWRAVSGELRAVADDWEAFRRQAACGTPGGGSESRTPKRSTVRGEAQAKIIAALTAHHQFNDERGLNQEPIKVNRFAETIGVARSSVSDFLKAKFGSRSQYLRACGDVTLLATALKLLNGEITPKALFGRTPPTEGRDDD